MNAIFIRGAAAVSASAVPAGIIASRIGSATDAPTPRNTARRDTCFLVMNTLQLLGRPCSSVKVRGLGGLQTRRAIAGTRNALRRELRTLDDSEHDRIEAILVAVRPVNDGADGRHVVEIERASERIGH